MSQSSKARSQIKAIPRVLVSLVILLLTLATASLLGAPSASARNPEVVSGPERNHLVPTSPRVSQFPREGEIRRDDLFQIVRNLETVTEADHLGKCSNFLILELRERMGEFELQRQVLRDIEGVLRQRQKTYRSEQFVQERHVLLEFNNEFTPQQRVEVFELMRKRYRNSVTLKKCEPPPDTVNRGTGSNQPPP